MVKVIKLTQGKFATVDDDLFGFLNQWKWHLGKGGYAYRRRYLKDGKRSFESIYMHRLINKTPVGFQTDHVNRNKLDNRKDNLRTVTSTQNKINIGIKRNNTSGYKGVWFDKTRNKWVSELMLNQRKVFMKRFSDKEEAITARLQAEKEYFNNLFA